MSDYSGSARYRLGNTPAQVGVSGGLDSVTSPSPAGSSTKLLSSANPVTVLLAIGAITLGFAGFATTIRVGNSSISGNLGKA